MHLLVDFRRIVRATLAFLSLLAFCSARATADTTVEIPVILSLTGNAAFLGHDHSQVLEIFEQYINANGGIRGTPLHFDVLDDQSSPQVAVQLMNTVLARHPSVVLGPIVTATCNAVEPLLANGPVDYCLSPSINVVPGSYMFATSTSSAAIMTGELNYSRFKGYHHVAAMVTTDAAGQHNESEFKALFASGVKGMQLVDVEHMAPKDTSVTAQLVNIRSAKPDVLFVYATGGDFGTVMRDLNAEGIDVPVVTSGANQNAKLLNQYKDVMPKMLLSTGIPFIDAGAPRDVKAAMDAFTGAFKRAGVDPRSLNVFGWDAANVVVAALRAVGPNASAAQLRDYIAHLHDFAGIDAFYDFPAIPNRGIGASAVFLLRWIPTRQDWSAVTSGGGKPL